MSAQWEIVFRVKKENKKHDIHTEVEGLLASNKNLPVVAGSLKVINRSSGGARSKGIGSDFERKIVKVLSDWWGLPLRRTPNSGGWDKQVQDGVLQAPGDIIAPYGSDFPFCIECKHRRTPLNLFTLQNDSSDCIFDWWKQCKGDSDASKKIPLLIASCGRVEYAAIDINEYGQYTKKLPTADCGIQVDVVWRNKVYFSVMHLDNLLSRFGRNNDGRNPTST